MTNPLFSDRDISFLLYEVFDAERLCRLPYFADHSRETFDLFLASARRLARESLYPAYKPMDEEPPVFVAGRVVVHPRMRELLPQLVNLGVLSASRPADVGGQQLPFTVAATAQAYLMAANLGAYGFVGLTAGAAHLIEAFGDDALKASYMAPMYDGRWTGTMALTEPGAGSSLSDVTTKAVPRADGSYSLTGTKIFISGGDHDLTENIVNMTLARIEGAPAGIKGVSLFAVPRLRLEDGRLVDNDVQTAGMIHKIGWRGLPSLVLNYGERGDCRGFLVGAPNKGINYMFQMMNEARIMVGLNGVATAAVAYQESLAYARTRLQGRPLQAKNPAAPQVPIIEHADVRRMLLRQKAIVEGGLALLMAAANYDDFAAHGADGAERDRARLLLDLLTPVAKSFPAEWGFESNALAVQIHGGYGYSSEYPVEAWLRDQKLNSIHEGTTGIQSMDLLGRKAVAEGGAALEAFLAELRAAAEEARQAGLDDGMGRALLAAADDLAATTLALAALGMQGDPEAMLRHSVHYLQAFSIVAVGWQWLRQAAAARRGLAAGRETDFYQGKLQAARYWLSTELPRTAQLLALCRSNEDSYAAMKPEWFG